MPIGLWYSARDGKLEATVEHIHDLSGTAVRSNGSALAISEGAIASIHRDAEATKVLIASEHFKNPWRLSIDHQSGEILVAENSFKAPNATAHHQVKRFDSMGRLLQTYGAYR
jgi:hypothetical protein